VDWLINLDHALFAKINLDWTNAFFDWLFPRITDLHQKPAFLIALIPFLIFWFWKKRIDALKWFFIAALSVSLSDVVAYRIVKPMFLRERPQFSGVQYVLRTNEHRGPSFPSNHATNMFAAAVILTFALPTLSPLFFLLAIAVSYSRVYVGVHFPLDVLAGALVGCLVALFVERLFRYWFWKPKTIEEPFPLRSS
jgi:undecaprenyl-diphosphatase